MELKIFKQLLLSFYCTSKRLTNKKMPEKIKPAAVLFFSFPFTFIAVGLYAIFFLTFIMTLTKSPFVFALGALVFITPVYYFARKVANNGFKKWHIEKEYKKLNKNERTNKIVFAFIFFWGCFAIQFWLANIALSSR